MRSTKYQLADLLPVLNALEEASVPAVLTTSWRWRPEDVPFKDVPLVSVGGGGVLDICNVTGTFDIWEDGGLTCPDLSLDEATEYAINRYRKDPYATS